MRGLAELVGVNVAVGDPKSAYAANVSRTASRLLELIDHSVSLLLKKYGAIPEPMLQEVFQTAEAQAAQSQRPILYTQIDDTARELYRDHSKRAEFYRLFVGKILDSLERTRFGGSTAVKEWRHLHQTDFKQIYRPFEERFDYSEHAKLEYTGDIGVHLTTMVNVLTQGRAIPLIDLTCIPVFRKGEIDLAPEFENPEAADDAALKPEQLASPEYLRTADAANFTVNFVTTLAWNSEGLTQILAIPGWVLDVHRKFRQPWTTAFTGDEMIYELERFRKIDI